MHYRIKKVAILGSGVMGSGIACQLANVGLEVLMLDILPQKPLETKTDRNRVAHNALIKAIKSKPAPLYKKEYASTISVGNLEDEFKKINDVDWIIEVVVERLDIKQLIFEKVEKYRKPGSMSVLTLLVSLFLCCLMGDRRTLKNIFVVPIFSIPRDT